MISTWYVWYKEFLAYSSSSASYLFSSIHSPSATYGSILTTLQLFVGNTEYGPVHDALLTVEEQRAHFSLWSALKSPLVLGNDPRHMTKDTLAILTNAEVLGVNQDALATPVTRLDRWSGSTANETASDGDKLYLETCVSTASVQQWKLVNSSSSSSGGVVTLRSALSGESDLCAGVYKCADRWPWVISLGTSAAAAAADDEPPTCSTAERTEWRLDTANATVGTRLVWNAPHITGWPGKPSGTGVCLSTEGTNVEIDTCGWSSDATQQEWFFDTNDATGEGQIISAHNGLCLATIGGADRYVGPLTGGKATALLFNRGVKALTISLSMDEVRGVVGAEFGGSTRSSRTTTTVTARDLWSGEEKQVDGATGVLAYTVPSHSIVHVRLEENEVM